MLNKVILMGRLTDNPDYRQTPTGVSVATFRLAVDRNYQKSGEERKADFISVVTWRNTADFVNRFFTKGQLVAVEGSLQTRDYTDNQGNRRYVTEVVADQVYFAEGKRNSDSNASPYSQQQNSYSQNNSFSQNTAAFTQPTTQDFSEVDFTSEDDLPF